MIWTPFFSVAARWCARMEVLSINLDLAVERGADGVHQPVPHAPPAASD